MNQSLLSALRRVGLVFLVGGFGASVFPSGAGAPQAQSERPPSLQHETGITLKLIQVFVTGKDGKSVADLSAQDFEISDNGRPVPVYHLEKHFAEISEEIVATPLPMPRLSRKYFLFFDFAFIHPRGVIRAKTAALHFLGNLLLPADEVTLLSYTAARGLTLHEYLTTDHQKVFQIVDGFGMKNAVGRAEILTDFIYAGGIEGDTPGSAGERSSEDEFFRNQASLRAVRQPEEIRRLSYVEQARQFVLTLSNLAKALRYVPGPKNIILFSGGIARQILFGRRGGAVLGEWSTPEQLAQQLNEYDAAQADSGLQRDFSEALKECRASDCPVYAVDVSRVQDDVDVLSPTGTGDTVREFAGADSLRQLAGDTGGKYYGNLMDAKASMFDIRDATGSYYILGFKINETWDGKFHKIKVKVLRKGCEVRTQGGYFNPKPFKSYSNFEKLLHMTDLALNENPLLQIPAEIRLSAFPVVVRGFTQIAAFARVPKDLAAEIVGKKSEAFLLVFDAKGAIVALKSYRFDRPTEEPDSLFPVFVVPLAPGRYSCRMVVRNRDTGKGARGAASIGVPQLASLPVWMDPPLLLLADRSAKEIGSSADATLSALYAYDRASYAPLGGETTAPFGKLYAALRCTSGGEISELCLSVSLIEQTSQDVSEVPFTIVGRSQEGTAKFFLLELAPGELKPGGYEFRFGAQRDVGRPAVYTTTVLTVK